MFNQKLMVRTHGVGLMSKNYLLAAMALAAIIPAHSAQAVFVCGAPPNSDCIAPSGGGLTLSKAYHTSFIAGLQWNFGDSQPELVLGVRRTQTSTSSQVRGAKIDLAIPLKADFGQIKPVVRVMGLAGNRDVQGEFGFGMRMLDWKPVVAAGAQIPYANGGINYVFGDGVKPYVGLNTVKRAVAPRQSGGALSCGGPPYALYEVSSLLFSVYPSAVVDGYTCLGGG